MQSGGVEPPPPKRPGPQPGAATITPRLQECASPDSNREAAGTEPTRSTKIPFTRAKWWPRQDFNLRPSDFQSDAPATELRGHEWGWRESNPPGLRRGIYSPARLHIGLHPRSTQECPSSDSNRETPHFECRRYTEFPSPGQNDLRCQRTGDPKRRNPLWSQGPEGVSWGGDL